MASSDTEGGSDETTEMPAYQPRPGQAMPFREGATPPSSGDAAVTRARPSDPGVAVPAPALRHELPRRDEAPPVRFRTPSFSAPVPARAPRGDEPAPPTKKPELHRGPVVDVLWATPDAAERVRRQFDQTPRPSNTATTWVTSGRLRSGRGPDRDARDVARALAARPIDAVSLRESRQHAVGPDGVYKRPLLLVEGPLTMAFSADATLKGMVAAARPYGAGDRPLRDAVEAATEATAADVIVLARALEALRSRLTEAFDAKSKGLPADYLERASRRALLEKHDYASRVLFGGLHHCAHLEPEGARHAYPAYLPAAAAQQLPLLERFDVRMLAEPHAPQDPAEEASIALAVVAIARITPLSAP